MGTQAQMCVGPWASFEEAWWAENRSIVKKEQDQELHEQTMAVKAGRGGPRRVISSANRRRCQKMRPIIQGDFSRSSIDKDMPYERAEGRRTKKYLEESYYHHIKCFEAISWAVFMLRKPLNCAALVAPTHRELKGVFDGTSTQVKA